MTDNSTKQINFTKEVATETIRTFEVGKIESINQDNVADIFLLASKSKINDIKIAMPAGAGFNSNYTMRKGDFVIVLFTQYSIEALMNDSRDYEPYNVGEDYDNFQNAIALPFSLYSQAGNLINKVGFTIAGCEASLNTQTGKIKLVGNNINTIKKTVEISNKIATILLLIETALKNIGSPPADADPIKNSVTALLNIINELNNSSD